MTAPREPSHCRCTGCNYLTPPRAHGGKGDEGAPPAPRTPARPSPASPPLGSWVFHRQEKGDSDARG